MANFTFSDRKPVFAFARTDKGSQVRVPTWEDFEALHAQLEELKKKSEAKYVPP